MQSLSIPNTSLILNDIEQIDILDINRFYDFFMYEWVFEKKHEGKLLSRWFIYSLTYLYCQLNSCFSLLL